LIVDDFEFRGYASRITHRVAVLGGVFTGMAGLIIGGACAVYGLLDGYAGSSSGQAFQREIIFGACINGASFSFLASALAFGLTAVATRQAPTREPGEAREFKRAIALLEELQERMNRSKDGAETMSQRSIDR
jgi:hypothetical protein